MKQIEETSQLSGLGKRVQNRRERQVMFLREAAKVFVKRGIRDATMEDIGAQIGVAKPVLYRFFASKEDIIDAILEQVKQQVLRVDRLPWEGYDEAVRRSLVVGWEDPAAFLLLTRDSRNDPVFSHHYKEFLESVAGRLTQQFLNLGVDSEHASLCGLAIAEFVINAGAHWIDAGDMERDDFFVEWVASGVHALDNQWRKKFSAEG